MKSGKAQFPIHFIEGEEDVAEKKGQQIFKRPFGVKLVRKKIRQIKWRIKCSL